MNSITYIGLDVHTTNYTICAYNIENDKTFAETTINPDIRELDKYLKKIQELQGGCKLVCGYEAGCLGYSLYQQLTAKGYECIILAPTTMPKTAKEIKTDKRDARKIAKCLAFGTYSKVFVPDDDDVAVKEYIRMRDDAKIMLKQTKQQIISGENGVIPLIDNTLPAGRYYLTEKPAPQNFAGIGEDLVFDITAEGEVVLVSAPASVRLLTNNETEGLTKYCFKINNSRAADPNADLTVTKIVTGSFGNKAKDFTFTLTVDGAGAEDTFAWNKSGESQTALQSGGTFTMQHNDIVVISLPKDTEITLAEDNENYLTTFRFSDGEAEECASRQFVLTGPADLTVTNTRSGIIPTGIAGSAVVSVLLFIIPLLPITCILYNRKRRRYKPL